MRPLLVAVIARKNPQPARGGSGMTSKLVAVIGAGLLAGVCVCVDAAVLCKGTRSASLKVRDVCKSYETQVDPLSLSACRAHPVVRDGNGTFVGCLVSDRNGGEVLQRDISGVKVW